MHVEQANEWAGLIVFVASAAVGVWVLSRHATQIEAKISMLSSDLRRLSKAIEKFDGKLAMHDRRIQKLEDTRS